MVGVFVYHDLVVNMEKDSFLKTLFTSVYPEGVDQNYTNPPSKCFQVESEKVKVFTDYILHNWRNVRIEVVTKLNNFAIQSKL